MSSTLVNMPWMAENLTASGAWGGQQTRYNLRSCKTRPNPGVPQPDAVLSACSKVGKVIKKNKKRNDGMAAKTKKNLTCFYCGTKSKQKQEGTIKEWDCKSCCATNYLDKVRFYFPLSNACR